MKDETLKALLAAALDGAETLSDQQVLMKLELPDRLPEALVLADRLMEVSPADRAELIAVLISRAQLLQATARILKACREGADWRLGRGGVRIGLQEGVEHPAREEYVRREVRWRCFQELMGSLEEGRWYAVRYRIQEDPVMRSRPYLSPLVQASLSLDLQITPLDGGQVLNQPPGG